MLNETEHRGTGASPARARGADPEVTRVVVIAGPTASGKSALALALAEALDGVVINADSMQVYRELSILTARPSAADCARVPHRLYGVLPAAERCSAGRWCELARGEIAAAAAAGRVPILVGGTGLYLRGLMQGLAPVPEVPAAVRAATTSRLERLGPAAFHEALARRDPVMAARLRPSDPQRLIRAWEVLEATGRSLASWQREATAPPDDLSFVPFVLRRPRPELYEACNRRFLHMLEAGALDEVRAMDALGLDPDLPAMKALGVPELRRHLRGELTLAEATAAAQQATRRYAKRQTTWFRHQMASARVLEAQGSPAQFSERLAAEIRNLIRH
jgi:tRNA dimethylallyltransferase